MLFTCLIWKPIKLILGIGKPQSTVANSTSEESIVLSWKAPEIGGGALAISKYVVSWTSSVSDVLNFETEKNSTQIMGLTSSTTYNITVAPVGIDDRMGESSETEGTTC